MILAPYGLAGTLTGQVSRVDNHLLEEWKHFYPINGGPQETGLPPLVEVFVSGVRMRYPSCYVLVTDMDETPMENSTSPPVSPGYDYPLSTQRVIKPAMELPERVWAECSLGAPTPSSKCPHFSPELGEWTFVDPTQKSSCTCSK